jgi:acetylornithine deacetylase/succinyl-diaminopimelate desuccinylase-like protein
VHEIDSRAAVAAFLDQGYTESQMYRRLGIQAYGFNPIVVSPEVNAAEHGVDERVPVRQYREALPLLYHVVRRMSSQ